MEKLKIVELRKIKRIPSKFHTKKLIIDFILSEESPPANPLPESVTAAPAAPVQTKQTIDNWLKNYCILCDASGRVISATGDYLCPVCRRDDPPGMEGPGVLRLTLPDELDMNSLITMVKERGHDLIDSLRALEKHVNSVEAADEDLREVVYQQAEEWQFAEAQLNSEADKDLKQAQDRQREKELRENMHKNPTKFRDIDEQFSDRFLFPSHLTPLISQLDAVACAALYDYLDCKRKATKWYRTSESAVSSYFGSFESALELIRGWDTKVTCRLRVEVEKLKEAFFSIPETGGSIPVIFRDCETGVPSDDDLECLGVTVPVGVSGDGDEGILDLE